MEIPAEAFTDILSELKRMPLYVNMYRLKSGHGRSQAFGIVNKRCMPPDYSRWCWKRPLLYKLLLEFAEKYVSVPFTSITVNQNYAAAPHKDKNNIGESFLVAFGQYSGGELKIHEGELEGLHDICRKPIVADFSKITHSVLPFEGERYSLVFYTNKSNRHEYQNTVFPPPSVRPVDGKLTFFRGEEKILASEGLPHPLRGRKNN